MPLASAQSSGWPCTVKDVPSPQTSAVNILNIACRSPRVVMTI